MEASTQISKESLGVQAMCSRVGILAGCLQEDHAWNYENEDFPGAWRCQEHTTSVVESHRQQAEPAQERNHVD
jgi:hypothetical protein